MKEFVDSEMLVQYCVLRLDVLLANLHWWLISFIHVVVMGLYHAYEWVRMA